jgi:hypothetical protein
MMVKIGFRMCNDNVNRQNTKMTEHVKQTRSASSSH